MKYLPFLLSLMAFCVYGAAPVYDTVQTPEIVVSAFVEPIPTQCKVWVEVDGVSSTTIALETASLKELQGGDFRRAASKEFRYTF
ncbi:hypothetical protein PYX08_06090 [Citrobacter freundii]|nr:hypothetical protein [Citrobacter freundii]